jgi:hypothetical protein
MYWNSNGGIGKVTMQILNTGTGEAKDVDETSEEIIISQTDYIKVMSLLPYRLNLCTRERGQGKVYRFDKLFQVKKIIYSDLVDILEVNRDFMEAGKERLTRDMVRDAS